jgi:hypothetical protein
MTLDEFLRTLETLIDDQVENDDPGEGNFGCQNCRACYSCRFCMGCDSCEDCTYCEESLDCTSCTQSKRCVTCEKVSYCEDCRDCKTSRFLTLCIDCTDCTHCLGCVGLQGAEFHVLNQKRSRKEYFTLLRQVQELLRVRHDVGWRPPTIGLSSEVSDPVLAGRDVELSTAPWLDDLFADPDPDLEAERDTPGWDSPMQERDLDAFAAELESDPELALPARPRVIERRPDPDRYPERELDPVRSHAWEDSRESTVARARPSAPEPRAHWIDDEDSLVDDGTGEYEADDRRDVPAPAKREPSSPWLDEAAKSREAARGSLRRAGRPTRKPESESESFARDRGAAPEHGTGTYRTGNVPKRTDVRSEVPDESTRTGLRTGRRPKRER